jgi:hypothetical protein
VQLYKMGRAGYWRLLLDVNSLRESGAPTGRRPRWAASIAIGSRNIARHSRRSPPNARTSRPA